MKTPEAKIKRLALSVHKTQKDFEKFLRNKYDIKKDSLDNVAVAGILYTMEEYDNDGHTLAFYNKRTDTRMEIETSNRYHNGYGDAEVFIFPSYGAWRNDITYLD